MEGELVEYVEDETEIVDELDVQGFVQKKLEVLLVKQLFGNYDFPKCSSMKHELA